MEVQLALEPGEWPIELGSTASHTPFPLKWTSSIPVKLLICNRLEHLNQENIC